MDIISFETSLSSQETVNVPFHVKYDVQPILQPDHCSIDFGVRDASQKHVSEVLMCRFAN